MKFGIANQSERGYNYGITFFGRVFDEKRSLSLVAERSVF